MPDHIPQDLVTPKQAARMLNRHTSAVYRWVQSGRLRAFQCAGQRLLISMADLAKVLQPVEVPQLPSKKQR